MRTLALLTLLCIANFAQATNYYFSALSGDDTRTSLQAQDPATPWKSIDKFNAISLSLKPGDSVFFKRNEVFYGMMNIKASGKTGANIYYGAYGFGANPVITGLVTVSGWTPYYGGIYYATLNGPSSLNMVTINGEAKGMGRWPNTGFLKVDSHVGNQSITSSGLTTGTNWSGGEIVMRKYRFILDRHTITSQSGTTLNYSTSTANGNNSAFSPVDKNGFFIQNHLSTLDQFGEWYYDPASKRLYVHFGSGSPSDYVVKASVLDYNISLSTVNFAMLENLNLEGGNNKGLSLTTSTNLIIKNCNFYNQGGSAVYGVDLNWVAIQGGSVNTSFSNGINLVHNANNCTVDGVAVSNSNMIPGSGKSGNGVSIGITVNGDNSKITNNRVINSGYSGIQFLGNNVLVEHNYIDTYCTLKDDGGGVYTFEGGANETDYNRKIRNNVILNAVGAQAGTDAYYYEPFGKGAGIYLDEYVNNVEISGNTIANGDWAGIFMHNAHDCQISNNIIYNHRYQMHVSQYTPASRNMVETNNQYISKYAFQEVWYYRTFVADNPSSMGTSNSNYFARPIDDNKTIHCDFYQSGGAGTQYYTLDQWKSYFSLDGSSLKSPITYKANIADSIRFEYNASDAAKVVNLDASYIDVKGTQYAGALTLAPYTSVVLLKTRSAFKQNQVITFPAISDKTYGVSPFVLTATSSSGLPVSYRVTSGPATIAGNMVTLTGMGTVTIEASQAGDGTYNAAPVATRSFNVVSNTPTKQNQTITFPAIANKTYGDAAFALTATASSGLQVSYRVVSGPATINGYTITLTGTGIITVEASQAGDNSYNAATPVQQSFTVAAPPTVSKQNQTISFLNISDKTYSDAPFTLNATASSGLPVSYRILSGPATISGNIITITGTGEVWVEASQTGNASFNAAPSISQNFIVAKADQTINFPAISNKTMSDAPFTLNATASSGLPVSYRILSGPATLSGNIVTITGNGAVWIEASQAGDGNYNWAPSTSQNFTVNASSAKASQMITFPALPNKTYGDAAFKISATASSGLPVSFRVVSGPATITGSTVRITGVGTVTIEASQDGNGIYSPAPSVSQSLTVAKAAQTITFGNLADKTFGDGSFALAASSSSGLLVSFRVVSGPATISGNTVTLTGAGTVTVEALQAGNSIYNAATPVQQSFTVNKANQTINFGSLADKTLGDPTFALTATASSGLPVLYRVVSGPATISGNTVTLTGAGNVTIEASQSGDGNYNAATPVQQSFTVQSQTTTKQNQTIFFGTLPYKTYNSPTFELSATASSGLQVSYRVVSGPATVQDNAVTITGIGLVTIEASQAGDNNFYPATPVQRSFTVGKASQVITFTLPGNKALGDAPFALGAVASSSLPVNYRVVSGPAIITDNTVTITGVGSVSIEASQPGDDNYTAAYPITRRFTVLPGGVIVPQTIFFPDIDDIDFAEPPFALHATASSGLPVSYRVVSGPAIISGNRVTITGVGVVTIEASQSGNAVFAAATPVTQSFTVDQADQTISFDPLADKYNGDSPFDLSATASSGLPVTYRVVSGPATISGSTVTLTGVGAVIVEASQSGDDNYNAATPVTQSFNVINLTRANQTITFGTLAYKNFDTDPFDISATASSGLPVRFTVVSGPATISGTTVTVTGIGFVTIEADQDGDSNYNPAAPVQRSFTVGKASQTLNFSLPSNKTLGDAPFALTATASSGLPVVYRVVSGPAAIRNGMVTVTDVGVVTIEASQPGNDYYTAAYPLARSFTVSSSVTLPPTANTRNTGFEGAIVGVSANTVNVYPNPVRTEAAVTVTAFKTIRGTVEVYNLQGRLIQKLAERTFERGIATLVKLNVQQMSSGSYIIRLASKEGAVTQRFEVVK
jgi:parallel beta-helix repeat protein